MFLASIPNGLDKRYPKFKSIQSFNWIDTSFDSNLLECHCMKSSGESHQGGTSTQMIITYT